MLQCHGHHHALHFMTRIPFDRIATLNGPNASIWFLSLFNLYKTVNLILYIQSWIQPGAKDKTAPLDCNRLFFTFDGQVTWIQAQVA